MSTLFFTRRRAQEQGTPQIQFSIAAQALRIDKKSAASILEASLDVTPPLWELGQESFNYIVKHASLMFKSSEERIEFSMKNAKSVVRYLDHVLAVKLKDDDGGK